MEQNKNPKKKDGKVIRVSLEFYEWVQKISDEFEKKRGFRPSDSSITTDIKRQFQGFFQV